MGSTDASAEGAWFEQFKKVSGMPQGPAVPPPYRGEVRQHPRFLIYNAAARLHRQGALTLFGLARKRMSGSVLDLSEGGVRVLLVDQLPIEARVRLQIDIEKFKDRIISDGKVRWCRVDPANPTSHQVGIMFGDLDPSVEKKIGLMREWFTSVHCTQYRERNRPAAPAARGGPTSGEVWPKIWSVVLEGDLDGTTLAEFAEAVEAAAGKGARGLLVDLSEARYVSPNGMARFLRIVNEASAQGAEVIFVAAPSTLRSLMILSGPNQKMTFAADLAMGQALIISKPGDPRP